MFHEHRRCNDHDFASASKKENQIRETYQQLVDCTSTIEKEIEVQERIKTKQLNEICSLSAQISELTDRVEKARLRENELAERVQRWVEYLNQEKEKMMARGSRLYATGSLSANVSDDIAYNINMLVQMRQRVNDKLLEIKRRKKEHKNQLRQLKIEMLNMHGELEEWDKKYDEIQEVTQRMEITRLQLLERIKEQLQKETAAKLTCIQLDKKLHELCGNLKSNEHTVDSDDQTMKNQLSMTETSESQDGDSLAGMIRAGKRMQL
ncbi:unnamed protein product [Angiostrongylus costaricensis]|uniref:BMERB domain-containing protein n=1 Tax=Angiostrongylus costaricensis TaxID=334426 RepID=A0A158PFT7_ANGCS|nr:unnamed protein product [Angiostrongylus costaricensis]